MRITYHTTPEKLGIIPDIENQFGVGRSDISEPETITFSEQSLDCCVGVVDIVDSTKIASKLSCQQIAKYYGIFLNSMGLIVKKYGGIVVKNIGDSILYYFPMEVNTTKTVPIDCALSMIAYHDAITMNLKSMGLPALNYRISLDFGNVVLAQSETSTCEDIFGPTVNMCAKINSSAKPNSVVVGSDLYQRVKGSDYRFEEIVSCMIGLKFKYPVYTVSSGLTEIQKVTTRAIEKTLLDLSPRTLDLVSSRLQCEYGCRLSDCYKHPEYLKRILSDIYGAAHTDILDSISSKLASYQSSSTSDFIARLG
ncbi:MAG: adenylate/guanylate cyclase domain-containing protein [Candidatus Nitrosotenuis sp.]|jgi:class 3 adenylate cyclase